MSKNLIIYYSRKGQNYVNGRIESLTKGNTEICAEFIHACTAEAKTEYENNTRPELKAYLKDISGYDNIFICGPCWCGTYPMAVFSLIESLNFQGKNVMPLMTHEGSGLGRSMQDINRICKGAVIKTGLAVHGADASKSEQAVTKWAKESLNV